MSGGAERRRRAEQGYVGNQGRPFLRLPDEQHPHACTRTPAPAPAAAALPPPGQTNAQHALLDFRPSSALSIVPSAHRIPLLPAPRSVGNPIASASAPVPVAGSAGTVGASRVSGKGVSVCASVCVVVIVCVVVPGAASPPPSKALMAAVGVPAEGGCERGGGGKFVHGGSNRRGWFDDLGLLPNSGVQARSATLGPATRMVQGWNKTMWRR